MRISDWSSDVCSSDLGLVLRGPGAAGADRARAGPDRRAAVAQDPGRPRRGRVPAADLHEAARRPPDGVLRTDRAADRKSVVQGKSESVRVDLGGRRNIKKTNHKNQLQ